MKITDTLVHIDPAAERDAREAHRLEVMRRKEAERIAARTAKPLVNITSLKDAR